MQEPPFSSAAAGARATTITAAELADACFAANMEAQPAQQQKHCSMCRCQTNLGEGIAPLSGLVRALLIPHAYIRHATAAAAVACRLCGHRLRRKPG